MDLNGIGQNVPGNKTKMFKYCQVQGPKLYRTTNYHVWSTIKPILKLLEKITIQLFKGHKAPP